MVNNGWIYNGDPLVDFAAPGSDAYLARDVVIWGDCVKLRYGQSRVRLMRSPLAALLAPALTRGRRGGVRTARRCRTTTRGCGTTWPSTPARWPPSSTLSASVRAAPRLSVALVAGAHRKRAGARVVVGRATDNCHSTPIHVGQYLLDVARSVRPTLFVVAELFAGSEEKVGLA